MGVLIDGVRVLYYANNTVQGREWKQVARLVTEDTALVVKRMEMLGLRVLVDIDPWSQHLCGQEDSPGWGPDEIFSPYPGRLAPGYC